MPDPSAALPAVATLPARPAVEVAVQEKPVVGWWLVGVDGLDHPEIDIAGGRGCGSGARVVAGPFADQLEADWAALARGAPASSGARVGYGVRRVDGTLAGRLAPAELAWLAELGGQLGRLGGDWDDLVGDTDPLTTLVVEVTAALTEAGLPLYDCSGPVPDAGSAALPGGVVLTPHPDGHGILVGWRCHDRMSRHRVRGAVADAAVRSVMNAAVAGVLAGLGYRVQPFEGAGCYLLTAGPR